MRSEFEIEINVSANMILAGLPCACGDSCCASGTCDECRESYEDEDDKEARNFPRDVEIGDIVTFTNSNDIYDPVRGGWTEWYLEVEEFRAIDCISGEDITDLLNQKAIDEIVDRIIKHNDDY